MKCQKCKSSKIVKRGKRYNKSGTKQLYLCSNCKTKFVRDDGFKRMRYKKKDIVRAIHLHSKKLSLAEVKDHLWQHDGVKVTRKTVSDWTKKYSVFLK
jgi:transposase-like protein